MHTNLLESLVLIFQITCAILQLNGQGRNIQLNDSLKWPTKMALKMAHQNGSSKRSFKMAPQNGPSK